MSTSTEVSIMTTKIVTRRILVAILLGALILGFAFIDAKSSKRFAKDMKKIREDAFCKQRIQKKLKFVWIFFIRKFYISHTFLSNLRLNNCSGSKCRKDITHISASGDSLDSFGVLESN